MANSLIKEMKERIAKSGSSKKEVLYFPPDSVKRIRFLQELDDGRAIQFHSDFERHIFEICKDPEDHENCDLCKDEVPILEQFAWSVWDYDTNAVKILCVKATGISPIPALIELYEEYGTLLDRDIKIKKIGKGVGGSFAVTPLDKSRFRNEKAKPFTNKQMDEIFNRAFGSSPDYAALSDDDDESEEKSVKKTTKKKSLRDKFENLTFEELKEICLEIGMSKKEIRAFEDSDEIVEELFENYEEEDLKEIFDNLDEDNDDDEDEE